MKIITAPEAKPIIDKIYGIDLQLNSVFEFMAIRKSVYGDYCIKGFIPVMEVEIISPIEFCAEIKEKTPSLEWKYYSDKNKPGIFDTQEASYPKDSK